MAHWFTKKNNCISHFKLARTLVNKPLLLLNPNFYSVKKEKTSGFLPKKTQRYGFSLFVFQAILLLLFSQICFSQIDTTRLKIEQQQQKERMKEAQQKAMEKLKQMGISIDPNKKMTKEEAQKLKEKLLNKGKEIQAQLPQGNQIVYQHKNIEIGNIPSEKQVVQIADRFFKRSYKQLDIFQKTQFNKDYKESEKNKFSLESVRLLANKGAELITFGNDHLIACVYITAAVKSVPSDTLSVNNFGGYLRIIDSVQASLPVLLYANKLFSKSPVILTQIGCSLLELNDDVKAEKYLKDALKYNLDFGQARTALCEVYIRQQRYKEAIIELFAGVKNMGATYQQASYANNQIQNGYSPSGKEEFWNETKKQLNPSDVLAPLVPEDDHIKMPVFPNCVRVEDWTDGGGLTSALEGYQSFHNYDIAFVKQFQDLQQQPLVLPSDAIPRDYPNERFAIDCITEMFVTFSKEESKKHHQIIKDITQKINDAKERYITNFTEYTRKYNECIQACPQNDTICPKECYRKYCSEQCPNANQYNDYLRLAYGEYKTFFNQLVHKQTDFLNDLYAFTGPWLAKIYSPYWSKIYAYEIKRTALAIVENTYMYYPQIIEPPVNDACGTDCSIYSVPFRANPEDINKKDPNGNECPEHTKFKIPLAICELGLDCESIEFGCTELLSASVKRNFRKKSTTLFVGVGLKGDIGIVSAGIKTGAVFTVNDNDDKIDIGGKFDASASLGIGPAKIGSYSSASYTVMKGFNSDFGAVGGTTNPFK